MVSVGQELLAVPFDEMVSKLAGAIADGQVALDQSSLRTAELMTKIEIPIPALNDKTGSEGFEKVPMIMAGFQPTFYQFTDTIIEVKMAISMNKTKSSEVKASAGGNFGPFAASVSASYSSKYSYSVEGSSLIRTKITPVPPNAFLAKLYELKTSIIQKAKMAEIEAKEIEIETGTTPA